MMKIYSFDITKLIRKIEHSSLYNLFEKNIMFNTTISLRKYTVPREFEMRLDLVSKYLYGTSDYIEELMVINNMISPYSVKENQDIYYCSASNLKKLYQKDDIVEDYSTNREAILNSTKKRKASETKIPTTMKPKNLKQVTVDTKNRKIKIMNSFK